MMTRMLFALSLGFAGLIHLSVMAQAENLQPQVAPQCAQRLQVIDILARKYGETRRGIGLTASNTLMEIYASTETGSWTIAVTMPDGVTCLMASGQGYSAADEAKPALGDPA